MGNDIIGMGGIMRLITLHHDLINVLPKLINPLFCLNFGNILDPGRPGRSRLC